jgi:uncharacterized protein (UPF0335 family)
VSPVKTAEPDQRGPAEIVCWGFPMNKPAFAAHQLRSFIERVERLEEEKAALAADIREVYSEAKGQGFDTKIMRQIIRLRKMDKADYQEQAAILQLYKDALGME